MVFYFHFYLLIKFKSFYSVPFCIPEILPSNKMTVLSFHLPWSPTVVFKTFYLLLKTILNALVAILLLAPRWWFLSREWHFSWMICIASVELMQPGNPAWLNTHMQSIISLWIEGMQTRRSNNIVDPIWMNSWTKILWLDSEINVASSRSSNWKPLPKYHSDPSTIASMDALSIQGNPYSFSLH